MKRNDAELFEALNNLPKRRRWFVHGTPLDFAFVLSNEGSASLPDEWVGDFGDAMLMFGEQDYAEGGGAQALLCRRNSDGWVVGLDGDRESPEFILNSSVDRFVKTFQFLDPFLFHEMPVPHDCHQSLQVIDPEAYPRSDWKMLVNSLLMM